MEEKDTKRDSLADITNAGLEAETEEKDTKRDKIKGIVHFVICLVLLALLIIASVTHCYSDDKKESTKAKTSSVSSSSSEVIDTVAGAENQTIDDSSAKITTDKNGLPIAGAAKAIYDAMNQADLAEDGSKTIGEGDDYDIDLSDGEDLETRSVIGTMYSSSIYTSISTIDYVSYLTDVASKNIIFRFNDGVSYMNYVEEEMHFNLDGGEFTATTKIDFAEDDHYVISSWLEAVKNGKRFVTAEVSGNGVIVDQNHPFLADSKLLDYLMIVVENSTPHKTCPFAATGIKHYHTDLDYSGPGHETTDSLHKD